MSDYMLIAENKEKDIRLLVEEAGEELGYYLYAMRLSTEKIYEDYLCNNLEMVFRKAKKDFNIESSEFKSVKEI
jgi:hypothetical protein